MTITKSRFRREVGVTESQYTALKEMKERGEVRRDKIVIALRSMHVLRDRGILEYVKSDSGKDDFWRLTDKGRELLRSWS